MSNVCHLSPPTAGQLGCYHYKTRCTACMASDASAPARSRARSAAFACSRDDGDELPPSVANRLNAPADAGVVGPRPSIGARQPPALQQRQHRQQHGLHKLRAASLAQALLLTPSQVTQMAVDYPALQNYRHAQLADKLLEMARMLQLHPQQLSQALTAKPKILGCSLGEFESRVRELQKLLGALETVAQLILQEPKLLSWSPHHLNQRIANMSACLGIEQDQLLLLLKQHPQLLPASSHWVRTLQLTQQLLQMAHTGFGLDSTAAAGLQQKQHAEQDQLFQQMAAVGQRIQQLGSLMQQQQVEGAAALQLRQQRLATLQGLHQQMQELQVQLQELQRRHQMVSLAAAQQYVLQHPELLLLPPEAILAHMATMQAQSGLTVAEVAAVVMAHPHLLMDHNNTMHDKSASSPEDQQQQHHVQKLKQQRQQASEQRPGRHPQQQQQHMQQRQDQVPVAVKVGRERRRHQHKPQQQDPSRLHSSGF